MLATGQITIDNVTESISRLRLRPRVDVIGIGVQKSATTWLFRCLTEHPSIRCAIAGRPTKKELNFFNRHFDRGYEWYDGVFELGSWKNMEFSTHYFCDLNVPRRIYEYNPEAKLLLSLRNPVERAFSQHKHQFDRDRLDAGDDFWAALAANPSYVDQGRYATYLAGWLEYFDLSQLRVVTYEDIRSRPKEVLKGIFEFIGVDPDFTPSGVNEPANVSYVGTRSRSAGVDTLVRKSSRAIESILGKNVLSIIKATGLPALARRLNVVEVKRPNLPPLGPQDRAALVSLFSEEIQGLSRILGRDFSHWK